MSQEMDRRKLLDEIANGPVYLYCEFEEVALRSVVVDGEVEFFIKYRDTREFKAVYDSRLVGIALEANPVRINRDEYNNF
jgi:hypothetical protein